MNIKAIHSRAAGVLRKVLNTKQPPLSPEEPKPTSVDSGIQAEPTDKTTN